MTTAPLLAALRPPVRGQLRTLDDAECRELLRDTGWGLLATDDDGQPYAVPVGYAYDEGDIFIATGPGRKLANLERNPRLCLTVLEVATFERWRSVVVTGAAERVTDIGDRLRAVRAFALQRRPGGPPSARDARRLLGARILRIAVEETTGRGRD
jgi:nitroimidazol reductase NimA-like FMN-containing flavoprotein (pyridoxamine 5'-phosphate oxidase superfamily)